MLLGGVVRGCCCLVKMNSGGVRGVVCLVLFHSRGWLCLSGWCCLGVVSCVVWVNGVVLVGGFCCLGYVVWWIMLFGWAGVVVRVRGGVWVGVVV